MKKSELREIIREEIEKENISKSIDDFVNFIAKKFKKQSGFEVKKIGKVKNYIRIVDISGNDESALMFVDSDNGDIYGANS
jgi:Na+/phosphate symporter